MSNSPVSEVNCASILALPEIDVQILFNFRNKQCQPSTNWFAKAVSRKRRRARARPCRTAPSVAACAPVCTRRRRRSRTRHSVRSPRFV
ncbi:hypothetical protein EMIT0158MI4_200014 [Burkholderia ambifaria]